MSDKSKIEWTDATWNPIRGCSRVSEGCRHCYAERIAARFSKPGQPYAGLAEMVVIADDRGIGVNDARWTGEVRFIPELLDQPLRWKRPRKIFVNSMSDLFHEKLTARMINEVFAAMLVCPQHTFQVLTKRPGRMKAYLSSVGARDIEPEMAKLRPGYGRLDLPWRNIWLGVSVEDQKTADERIPLLLATPAAVRWVSYEPALGPVDFRRWLYPRCPCGQRADCDRHEDPPKPPLDWIVAGGESGPGARPAHPDWFRSALADCEAAGVPFFFKQWGEWLHASQMNGAFTDAQLDSLSFKTVCRGIGPVELFFRVGKKRAGHLLDGTAWQEFPKERI